jgi:hypothetical protein
MKTKERWELEQRLLSDFKKVLNWENISVCRQVVDKMVEYDYIQPLWSTFCAKVRPSTPDAEVLQQIRDFKRITGWTCAPGYTPGSKAVPLDEFM